MSPHKTLHILTGHGAYDVYNVSVKEAKAEDYEPEITLRSTGKADSKKQASKTKPYAQMFLA